jgi:oxygen-dependent protoporphyrinogen oxidase
MPDKKKYAVVGAGISGLSIAFWLRKRGIDSTVFESTYRTGGSIVTEKKSKFLIDLGPNSTLETSPIISKLISDAGIENKKCYANEASNNRYILRNGKLHALPMSPGKFISSSLFSLKAKLRLFKEPFIRRTSNPDISLADFVRHRLGQEFLDYAINPFVAGVYAGQPERLSTSAAFPKLYALEDKYGSLIKGAILGIKERKKRPDVSKDRAKLFSFLGGMSDLPEALKSGIKKSIKLGREVTSIEYEPDHIIVTIKEENLVSKQKFDGVVITTPTESTAHIVKNIAPDEAKLMEDIEYAPVAVVYMAFKRTDILHDLNGFGFLVPEKEKRKILGSIWSSSIFPERVPEGFVAFTTFVGGSRQPDLVQLNDDKLKEVVLKELNDILPVQGQPVITMIKRWSRAIPQYTLGYNKYQRIFEKLEEKYNGLYFSGNFWHGISVGDCIISAHNTVEKIINRYGFPG